MTTQQVTMQRATYKTEHDVEIRTMGLSLRPIRLYFEVRDSHKPHGEREHEHNSSLVGLTARMFAVDVERNRFELIPALGRVHFDPSTVPGMVGGRLERMTSDHIEYVAGDKPFDRGYQRIYTPGDPERTVSEPFMLFGVVTLGREQFKEQRERAECNYRTAPQNPVLPRGAWD